MHKRYFVAGYRLIFGIAVLVAVITQYIHGVNTVPNFSALNFFSYFTIESNIFAAGIFILTAGLLLCGKKTDRFVSLRATATLYMTITGIVYTLLLSGLNVQTTLPWVNSLLHYIMPAIVLIDWFIDLPKKRIALKRALLWLIFPLAYLAYSLIRGHFVGWYPYPFLNPADDGYLGVAVVSAIIAAAAFLLTLLFAWTSRLQNSKKGV